MQSVQFKILGFALILFIVVWALLTINASKGLNKAVFNAESIDSIVISGPKYNYMLDSISDISAISNQLRMATRIYPDRTNINTNFTDLYFYLNNKEDIERVRINDNVYNGILIEANNHYYKNDSLAFLIAKFSKHVSH
ncbi:hypothetical protein [Flavihumibacter sp. ZG627]|uniref:hypothetical protein n=1 Tax=Flavihumibacter sp. ZG627 TaxID=1463156 RepID=UPI00057E7DC2|nr:hypothetical protein [Flavihumibacter sp. ZG627]KIC89044.1 hypothetical protein HY58_19065 [Flavihumibacter sp. ZG627]